MPGSVITLRNGQSIHLEDVSVTRAKLLRREKGVLKLTGPKGAVVTINGSDITKVETVPHFLA